MIELNQFISKSVTGRSHSMFSGDLEANKKEISREIEGKSILVIGGAGTIGSSYIRSVLPFRPATLVVVDINENGLTELTRDLRSSGGFIPDDYVTYPMSYADPVFEKMFRSRHGFDIVANFSAHKHVRSEKDIFSVEALLENNVVRARKLLDLLREYRPKHFFCVSTDKAANPVNIMGASKKIMEDMIMAYSKEYPVTTARFANVAFSNGSLPAGFIERFAKRQPISAPDDVTRYFVSPDESGQICLLASVLGGSGEIYFPKLSKERMVKFSDIASRFIKANGYRVLRCHSEEEAIEKARSLDAGSKDYPVYYSGSDTTGEKSYEEFFTNDEKVDMDRYQALGVITSVSPRPCAEIDRLFADLQDLFHGREVGKNDIVNAMQRFLKNFNHIETGKYLDEKM